MRRRPALAALRQADWLGVERGRAYLAMIAAMVLFQACNLALRILRSAFADPLFRPEPTDFDTFWAAARLTLRGVAASVYVPHAMAAAEAIGAQPAPGQFFPYLNPPIFLLLGAPLGWLAYLPAMAAFSLGGYGLIVACLRRLLPVAWPALAVLAFPAAMLNATFGQNGWLTAACYTGAALLLDRRPVLAGMCLGLLAYKPHLALCVPVALLAARRWRALASCAASAAGLALVSWAVLGDAVWVAFLHSGEAMRTVLLGADTWPRMLSSYAAVRILHGGLPWALAAQLSVSLGSLACLAWLAARRPGGQAEMAAAAAAAMLCTPYLLDYDLVCLGVPMAWLAGRAGQTGWRGWEKALLCVLYLYPLLARNCNAWGLPLTPLLLCALLALLAGRMRAERPQAADARKRQHLGAKVLA